MAPAILAATSAPAVLAGVGAAVVADATPLADLLVLLAPGGVNFGKAESCAERTTGEPQEGAAP